MTAPPQRIEEGPQLSLATGTDGRSGTSVKRLVEAADRMGLDRNYATGWLQKTAMQVAQLWEPMLQAAARPVMADPARMARLVDDVRPSFAYSEWLARTKPAG
jgi:hypothetical protein